MINAKSIKVLPLPFSSLSLLATRVPITNKNKYKTYSNKVSVKNSTLSEIVPSILKPIISEDINNTFGTSKNAVFIISKLFWSTLRFLVIRKSAIKIAGNSITTRTADI